MKYLKRQLIPIINVNNSDTLGCLPERNNVLEIIVD